MKKRILLVLTLLVAFFGFMGLSISNKQVELFAQTQTESDIQKDLNIVKNNIPSTAIISFPLTYQSVYGNDITFEVIAGTKFIEYDEIANWMIVHRSENEAGTATIKITVTNEQGESISDEKPVTIPMGKTTTRSFNVTYDYNYPEESGQQTKTESETYKLGDKTFDLKSASLEGYIFDGWYEAEATEPTKYVKAGSMQNYTFKAKWTKILATTIEVVNYEKNQVAGTEFNRGDNFYVIAHYNDGTTQDISNEVTVTPSTISPETNQVTVKWINTELSTVITLNVSLQEYDMGSVNVTNYEEFYNGKKIDLSTLVSGYPEGVTPIFKYEDTVVTDFTNAGTYNITVSFTHNNDNYSEITTEKDLTVTIKKLNLTLTPNNEKSQFASLPLLTWTNDDFDFTGNLTGEDLDVIFGLDKIYSAKYQLDGNIVDDPRQLEEDTTYTVVFDDVTASNYNVTINTGILNIKIAGVLFEGKEEYTYIGEEQQLYVKAKIINDDNEYVELDPTTYNIAYTSQSFKNAGTHKVEFVFTSDEYGIIETSTEVTIYPAYAYIVVSDASSTYGDELALDDIAYIPANFYNEEFTKIEFTPTTNATMYSDCSGTYITSVSYDKDNEYAKNYNIYVDTGVYTLNKRSIIIAIDEKSSVYNEDITAPTYTIKTENGLVNNDNIDGNITLSTDAKKGDNVGTYEIDIEISTHTNYDIKWDEVVTYYNITPKELSNSDVTTVLSTYDNNLEDAASCKPSIISAKYNDVILEFNELTDSNYTNYDKAGIAIVTFELKGNYSGTISYDYVITKQPRAFEDAKTLDTMVSELTPLSNGSQLPLVIEGHGSTVLWNCSTTGVSVDNNGYITINEQYTGENIVFTALITYMTYSVDGRIYTFDYDKATKEVTENGVTIEGVKTEYNVTITVDKETSNYTVEGEDVLSAYDITFIDSSNNEVNEPGDVKVMLPLPEGYTLENWNELSVYHVVKNGESPTYKPVNSVTCDGQYLIFTANSFSPYIITKTSAHEHNFKVHQKVEATCTAQGYTTYKCECGESKTENYVNPLGHLITHYEKLDATCTTDGHNAYDKCSRCDYTTYSRIPATGHTHVSTVTNPTCTKQGYTTYTCSCGDTYTSDEVPANGHSYVNSVCSVCGVPEDVEFIEVKLATFEFGNNGTASHYDGSLIETDNVFDDRNYLLTLEKCASVYTGARDSMGNSCLKLGTGSSVGSFSFIVPDNVTKTIIYVACYKANSLIITINDINYSITSLSNNGEYDSISIDTSINKKIELTTITDEKEKRAMINTIEFYGKVESKDCATVTFISKDGDTLETKKIVKDTYVSAPKVPTIEGYDFIGWYSDYEYTTPYDFEQSIVNDTIIYAKYKKYYTITYVSNGGIITSSSYDKYYENEGIENLVEVNKVGFVFEGWFDNEECSGEQITSISKTLNSNIILYAKWSESDTEIVYESVNNTYIFEDYPAGKQYAENEQHELDIYTNLTINGAHLNTQVRLYAGSDAVMYSTNIITKIVIKAGYKAGSLKVYASKDGIDWTLINTQSTTTSYKNYEIEFDSLNEYKYVKMESVGAQIRISEVILTTLVPTS